MSMSVPASSLSDLIQSWDQVKTGHDAFFKEPTLRPEMLRRLAGDIVELQLRLTYYQRHIILAGNRKPSKSEEYVQVDLQDTIKSCFDFLDKFESQNTNAGPFKFEPRSKRREFVFDPFEVERLQEQ
jgi:hypothetical protein